VLEHGRRAAGEHVQLGVGEPAPGADDDLPDDALADDDHPFQAQRRDFFGHDDQGVGFALGDPKVPGDLDPHLVQVLHLGGDVGVCGDDAAACDGDVVPRAVHDDPQP